MSYTVDMVYTIDMVYTVDMVYTGDEGDEGRREGPLWEGPG